MMRRDLKFVMMTEVMMRRKGLWDRPRKEVKIAWMDGIIASPLGPLLVRVHGQLISTSSPTPNGETKISWLFIVIGWRFQSRRSLGDSSKRRPIRASTTTWFHLVHRRSPGSAETSNVEQWVSFFKVAELTYVR